MRGRLSGINRFTPECFDDTFERSRRYTIGTRCGDGRIGAAVGQDYCRERSGGSSGFRRVQFGGSESAVAGGAGIAVLPVRGVSARAQRGPRMAEVAGGGRGKNWRVSGAKRGALVRVAGERGLGGRVRLADAR